jgi:hypothetical protein
MQEMKPLLAVHVDASTRKSMPLRLYYGRPRNARSAIVIIDLTPDAEVVQYSGESMAYALADFVQRNRYPAGYISYYDPYGSNIITRSSSGKSSAQKTAETLGTASTILGGIGALLAITPFDVVAPVFLVTASGLAALKSSIELDDLLGTVNAKKEDVTVNVVDIAFSIYDAFSGAGALEEAASGARRFLFALHGATTAAKYVYTTSQTLEKISLVLGSRTVIDPTVRSQMLRDIMVQLVFDHAIMFLGVMSDADSLHKSMDPNATKTSLSEAIPDEIFSNLQKRHPRIAESLQKLGPGEAQGMINTETAFADGHEETLARIGEADESQLPSNGS